MLPEQQMQQQPDMSLDQLQKVAINVVESLCGIICMPVDIILRPQYGTRYYPLPVSFFSMMLMIFLPFLSATATAVTGMIPFHHSPPVVGLFGIGAFAELYFLLLFVHGFRLWRRMIYMNKEQHSCFEGAPLPFFRLIPRSGSFWLTRIVYEPIFVIMVAWILGHTFIIQSGLATYLYLAAFALAMKNFCAWYRGWEYLRNLMDMQYAAPIIAKWSRNEASDDELAQIHLASLPKNIPSDFGRAAIDNIKRVFAPQPAERGDLQ
jgi:hypothetical protein